MEEAVVHERATMNPEACHLEVERMVQEDRWREIHRMSREEKLPIAEIARRLDLDRKTGASLFEAGAVAVLSAHDAHGHVAGSTR